MGLQRGEPSKIISEYKDWPNGSEVTCEGTVERVWEPIETKYGPNVFFTYKDSSGEMFAAQVNPPPPNLSPGRTFWMGQGDRGGAKMNVYVSKKTNEKKSQVFTDTEALDSDESTAQPHGNWRQNPQPQPGRPQPQVPTRTAPAKAPDRPSTADLYHMQRSIFDRWMNELSKQYSGVSIDVAADISARFAAGATIAYVDRKTFDPPISSEPLNLPEDDDIPF
jgi:hypothetical protein